jgi:soluble lytic murein transglycosylase-like protein
MTVYKETFVYQEIDTPFTSLGPEQQLDLQPWSDPVNRRMVLALAAALLVGSLMFLARLNSLTHRVSTDASVQPDVVASDTSAEPAEAASAFAAGQLAPIFTAEVMHWQPKILEWAAAYGLDPNIVATIMQVESCGDPQAISVAGARGLFQVMPFHFADGEDSLDPDTNARRGLSYYVDRLAQTGGNVGQAFAGYNGGHVAAAGSWGTWANETQRYFVWTTGLYDEAGSGAGGSATLQEWLTAGGASLCRQAAMRLGLSPSS